MYCLKNRCLAAIIAVALASTCAATEVITSAKAISNEQVTTGYRKEQFGWFYGLFANASASPYRGVNYKVRALPVIGYKGKLFSWTGPRLSHQLIKQNKLTASALLQYQLVGFEASDSAFFTGMNRRYNALFGGLDTSYSHEKLTFKLAYLHDLQGRSSGSETKLSVAHAYNIGPVFITPSVAINHLNSHYSNYYYGVRDAEARPERRAYRASSTLNKSVGLSVATPIFFGGFSRLALTRTWLGSAIKNSPLSKEDKYWQVSLTFSRFF